MSAKAEWSMEHDEVFAEAVAAIVEGMAEGGSFEHNLEHYAALYEIEVEALRHEWNLRKGEAR